MTTLKHMFEALGLLGNVTESKTRGWESVVPWALADGLCLECGSALVYCTDSPDSESLRRIFSVCLAAGHTLGVENLSQSELELIEIRIAHCLNTMGSLGLNFENLMNALSSAGGLKIEIDSNPHSDAGSSEIPLGFKSVGWIKPAEAQLVIDSHTSKTDLSAEEKGQSFRVEYFDPGSPEAKKYHSSTKLVRLRRGDVSKSFWIRFEEAESIIESFNSAKSIEFAHLNYGNGGLVQYFDPNSDSAKRFRSSTRLLRRY